VASLDEFGHAEFKDYLHREFPSNAPSGSIRWAAATSEVDERIDGARGRHRLHGAA
jgi:hypothetical protein